jgi:hypothetical protein
MPASLPEPPETYPTAPDVRQRPGRFALLLSTAAVLSACGGSGADESATVTATTTASTSPATSAPSTSTTLSGSTDSTSTPTTSDAVNTSSPSTPLSTQSTRWQPHVGATWHWQLAGPLNTSYSVSIYDIDLFDTPASTIAGLRASGKRVVCYFSAGSAENWRPDFNRFTGSDLGHGLDGWAGERWVDTRSANVREIMKSRLDLAAIKGCDGVEPDNIDGYTNQPGMALTASTQLNYNRFLAEEAHARGLAIGLKNDIDQLRELEPHFDFAVNEQCHQYDECGGYSVFTSKGKPVFIAEYASKYRNNIDGARDALCAAARAANYRALVLDVNLDDSFRHSCD